MNPLSPPPPTLDTGYGVRVSTAEAMLPVTSSGLSTSGTTVGANAQSSSSGRTEAILCPARGYKSPAEGLKWKEAL